jgi:AraC-like DNA-binding protein
LAGAGLFWLFAASLFDDDFGLSRRDIGVVAADVLFGVISTYGDLSWRADFRVFQVFEFLWRALAIGMVLAGIVVTLRGRANDLIETRRRVRISLSLAMGMVILWMVLAELPLKGWPPPLDLRVANTAGLCLLAASLVVTALGWRDPNLLARAPNVPAPDVPRLESDDSALLAKLQAEMTRERLYRQDGLTITAVAARLGVPEYRLRRAINQGLGERNFNAYLNSFRLAEVREALSDAAQRTGLRGYRRKVNTRSTTSIIRAFISSSEIRDSWVQAISPLARRPSRRCNRQWRNPA